MQQSTATRVFGTPFAHGLDKVRIAISTHPVLTVFTVALLVRVALAVVLVQLFPQTFALDDETYSSLAHGMATNNTGDWTDYMFQLFRQTWTLLLPLTGLYKILGFNPYVGPLLVTLAGAGTAAAVTRIGLEVLDRRFAVLGGLLVALFPSQILWSSLTLKDAVVWCFLSSTGAAVAINGRLTGRKLLVGLILLASSLLLLGYVRQHSATIACWSAAIACWFGIKESRLIRSLSTVGVAMTMPILMGIGPAGIDLIMNPGSLVDHRLKNAQYARSAIVELPPTDPGYVGEARTNSVTNPGYVAASTKGIPKDGGISIDGWATLTQPTEEVTVQYIAGPVGWEESFKRPAPQTELEANLAHLPLGLRVVLFEPVPWSWEGSTTMRFARLEGWLWYPLLLLSLLSVPLIIKRPRVLLCPALIAIGVTLLYALTEGNIGSAFRHRGEFVWTVALFAACGVAQLAAMRAGLRPGRERNT